MTDPASAPSRLSKFLVFGLVLLLVGGGVFWWMQRGNEEPAGEQPPVAASDGGKAELARKKHRAREAAEPAKPVGLFGTVKRAEDGSGIEGAVVLLNRRSTYQGVSKEVGRPSEPLSAVTDEKGDWRIDGVPVGQYAISATARGFLPATNNELRVLRSDEDQRVELTMNAGGHSLSGLVKDIGGGGIEGVLLRVDSVEGVNFFGMNRAPLAAVSDEEGRYEVFVGEGRYVISTFHPDYVATQRLTQVVDGPRVENLELVPGGAIEGVVVNKSDGKPIEGAQVIFQDNRSAAGGMSFRTNISPDGRRVMTDAQGRFALAGLSPGIVRVDARAEHFAARELVEVPIGIGETVTDVRVEMEPAFKVSGFVVPKGDPEGAIEGVVVGAYTLAPFTLLASSEPSDSEGYFEIHGLQTGSFTIGALSDKAIPSIAGTTVNIKDADVADLIVELDRGSRVVGRVEPPEIASVDLQLKTEETGLGTMMNAFAVAFAGTKSTPDGAFDLGPIKPGSYKLVAKGRSGASTTVEIEIPEEGLTDFVVNLEPRASVSGQVIDETGIPMAGVSVSFQLKKASGVDIAAQMRGGGMGDGFATGEEGEFRAVGLDAGEYLVSVTDRRQRRIDLGEEQEDTLVLAEAEVREGFDVIVVGKNGEISGVVLDAEGLPVADAFVTAALDVDAQEFAQMVGPARPKKKNKPRKEGVFPDKDDDEGSTKQFEMPAYFAEQPVLTDQAGNFLIKGLSTNKDYVVVAEGDKGGAKARERGVRPGERLELTLQANGSLTVTVKGAAKLDAYSVTLEGPSSRNKRVRDTADPFTLERLEAGEYTLKIDADSGATKEKVSLGAGEDEKLEVEIEDFAKISGSLVSALDGEPIKGALVLLVPEDGGMDPQAAMAMMMGGGSKTSRKGAFELTKVKPGKGTIIFMDGTASFAQMGQGGGPMAIKEFEVEGGDELDLGEIQGMTTPEKDAEGEEGVLGFRATVATYAKRPRPVGTDLEQEEESEQDSEERERLWVSWVEIGGPADEAGLQPGDEIISIDGRSVKDLSPYAASQMFSPGRVRAGQTLNLQIDRQGSSESVELEAVAKPKEED